MQIIRAYKKLKLMGALAFVAFVFIGHAHATPEKTAGSNSTAQSHQFDFLLGDWTVHNRKLKASLAKSSDWIEFDASDSFHALAGDLGTEENYQTDHSPGFNAIGLHLYQPVGNKWTLYWADTKTLRELCRH